VEQAGACDLAGIVDGTGACQDPARTGRQQSIEIDQDAPAIPEGVLFSGDGASAADSRLLSTR
jgi:hypothetical protein